MDNHQRSKYRMIKSRACPRTIFKGPCQTQHLTKAKNNHLVKMYLFLKIYLAKMFCLNPSSRHRSQSRLYHHKSAKQTRIYMIGMLIQMEM